MLETFPDNYFNDDNKILTFDDTRDYENFIKGKLVELEKDYSKEVKNIENFIIINPYNEPENINQDIIQLFYSM